MIIDGQYKQNFKSHIFAVFPLSFAKLKLSRMKTTCEFSFPCCYWPFDGHQAVRGRMFSDVILHPSCFSNLFCKISERLWNIKHNVCYKKKWAELLPAVSLVSYVPNFQIIIVVMTFRSSRHSIGPEYFRPIIGRRLNLSPNSINILHPKQCSFTSCCVDLKITGKNLTGSLCILSTQVINVIVTPLSRYQQQHSWPWLLFRLLVKRCMVLVHFF